MLANRFGPWFAAAALLGAGLAQAQTPVDRPTRLPSVGRSIVSVEDSSAIVVNPANLASLQGGEFRWQAVFLDDEALVPWQGHAFTFAAPIPFINMGFGLRLDLLDPTADGVGARFGPRSNYQWLTAGFAFNAGDANTLGFSFQHAYSENPLIDDLGSWSFGYTTRPVNHFGMAFVANDINAPVNAFGGGLERSYDIGLAIRPLGTRFVELGIEGRYVDAIDPYWSPRATLGIDVPSLGRLRGDFLLSQAGDDAERAWLASAQMAFAFNGLSESMELAGGSIFGNGLGDRAKDSAGSNLAIDVAFRGFRDAVASEAQAFALRIRIENTPSTREHVALLRELWRIATDEPSTAAVLFELRTAPADSLARVSELRDAIALLRRNGKKVICHLEDADGGSLYLCSAANKILVNPAGGIRFAGLRSRYFYLKSLLDKLGIRADFIRIGEHKSAPEMFTRDGATDVSRADKIDLLQQIERNFVLSVAAGRRIRPELLRQRIATGPFLAAEARAAGLVDGYAFDDQLEAEASKLVGYDLKLVDHDDMRARSPKDFGMSKRVAVIYVDGDMIDGRSQTIPFLGIKLVGSYTIAEAFKQAREDDRVGAVVFRIETGGGSSMAADVIWRQVQLTARVKPVVVSMGSAAASAGYYIAAPATRIYANPLSVTGSIGVFYGKADVSELFRKIGVSVEVYKTAPRADVESIFRPFTDEERRELERKVAQFYDIFLTRVSEGRRLSKQAVDAVGQGRVWTGEQALERKLVDELGGLRQALAEARRLAGMPEDGPIVELPPSETTLLGRLLGIEGLKSSDGLPLPPQIYEFARALAPFAIYPSDRPLMLMEVTPIGP
jgi:protease IV